MKERHEGEKRDRRRRDEEEQRDQVRGDVVSTGILPSAETEQD